MKIQVKEINSQEVPNFIVSGKTLTIDNEVLDFTSIPNGATVEREEEDNKYFLGAEISEDGKITVKILFPYNADTYEKGKVIAKEIEVIDGIVNPYVEVQNEDNN